VINTGTNKNPIGMRNTPWLYVPNAIPIIEKELLMYETRDK